MTPYTVRQATAEDLPAITALAEKSARVTGLPPLPPAEVAPRLLAREAMYRLVACDLQGRIVGHGMLETPNPDHMDLWTEVTGPGTLAEIGGGFTEPDLRGRGIGALLMEEALRVCRQKKWTPVAVIWSKNLAVQQAALDRYGAVHAGSVDSEFGSLDLMTFPG